MIIMITHLNLVQCQFDFVSYACTVSTADQSLVGESGADLNDSLEYVATFMHDGGPVHVKDEVGTVGGFAGLNFRFKYVIR